MSLEINVQSIRYAVSVDIGQPVNPPEGLAWAYPFLVRLVPCGAEGPLPAADVALLERLGFVGVHTAAVTVAAGEGGLEPTLQAVMAAMAPQILTIVGAAREAWCGKSMTAFVHTEE